MAHVDLQLSGAGRSLNYVFRSDNNGTVQGLVGAGVGISVSPRLTVDEDDPSIDVIDLHGRIEPRVIGLVWHTSDTAARLRRRSSTPRSPSAASSRSSPRPPNATSSRRRDATAKRAPSGIFATGDPR